jgi:hypothetical protein
MEKFNQLWGIMAPYSGFDRFNKPYSQAMQCSRKEMKALRHMIGPVFAATLLNPLLSQMISFTDILICIKNLEYFNLMALY